MAASSGHIKVIEEVFNVLCVEDLGYLVIGSS